MQITKVNRATTSLFSSIGNRLSYQQNSLDEYIQSPFSLSAFKNQILLKENNFDSVKRENLVQLLSENYRCYSDDKLVEDNIKLLKNENTYTITTGHQLSIFSGPIYVIYKILHVIKLCSELKKEYPSNNFIPVFWMASEDHDFEEIQSIQLFNKEIKWTTDQGGAVGRFDFSSFDSLKKEFLSFFENVKENEVVELISKYEGKTLGEATFHFYHQLFKEYGLLILDGDQKIVKKEFSKIVEKELRSNFSFKAVSNTNSILSSQEIKLQVSPREINLFFLNEGKRERIIPIKEESFQIGEQIYSLNELLDLNESQPESFSPNVILRPVYQELILPNLCYVGGTGEMNYWLQLKGVFDSVNIPFPLIQVRNSLMYIDSNSLKKVSQLQLKIDQLFLPNVILKKQFIDQNSNENLDFIELKKVEINFEEALLNLTNKFDSGLVDYVKSEVTRFKKQIETIEQKFIKSEKSKYDISLKQIDQILEKLFPNSGLQERTMNFFQICSDGQVYSNLAKIFESIDPFENDLIVYS